MPKQLKIVLTPQQQTELEKVRDTDKRPYMREQLLSCTVFDATPMCSMSPEVDGA